MQWGLVSTVSEPAPLVLAFVAHYASLGASQIDIHLDVPDADLAERLLQVPGCNVFQKTVRDWVRAGHFGPPSPPRRQAFNAQESYSDASVDWLLHVDADEFLIDREAVFAKLSSVSPDADFLSLRPMERVTIAGEPEAEIFSGTFRHLVELQNLPAIAPIYGEAMQYLDFGLSGNGRPKSFCRTGRGLLMGVHEPRRPDGTPASGELVHKPALLHFDGLTRQHFFAKLDRRISQEVGWWLFPAPGRRAQMLAVHKARGNDSERADLYRSIKCITRPQEQELRSLGFLEDYELDLHSALKKTFKGFSVDLSCRNFDGCQVREMALPWYWRLWNEVRGRSHRFRRYFRSDRDCHNK